MAFGTSNHNQACEKGVDLIQHTFDFFDSFGTRVNSQLGMGNAFFGIKFHQ